MGRPAHREQPMRPTLTSLTLRNFRRFAHHEIRFTERTLLVGANNAGKSTVVQALRLVAVVTNRVRGLTFEPPPEWLASTPAAARGVRPSLRGLEIPLGREAFHRYGEPPAVVTAVFSSKWSIDVFVGDSEVFGVIRDSHHNAIASRKEVPRDALPRMGIQPQVGPVEANEGVLRERTVVDGLRANVSAAHFRNQLLLLKDDVSALRSAAETTWPGLQIRELKAPGLLEPEGDLTLEIRDGSFVGELAVMGHGLQMWLQMLWFLIRARDDGVVVLDEPDVYMHPDLQRRLLRYLQGKPQQVIVATHSVEMMSEVEPDEIVTVDATRRRSRRARTLADAQKAVALVGGVHNLQLQRLWSAERVLFIEGQDLDVLKRLHRAQYPQTALSLDANPNMETGGWGGWPIVPVVARFLRDAAEQDLPIYCILDSDYHWPEQISARLEEARAARVDLAIWEVKELENLLLVPDVVYRELTAGSVRTSLEAVVASMEAIADAFRDVVVRGFADTDKELNPHHQPSTSFECAEAHVAELWTDLAAKLRRVPGKKYGQRLSAWTQETYGISLGPSRLARQLRASEFDDQLVEVLDAVQEIRPLQSSGRAS